MSTENERGIRNWMALLVMLLIFAMSMAACNTSSDTAPTAQVEVESPPVEPETTQEISEWSPEIIQRFPHEEKVSSVAWSNDGQLLATGIFLQTNIWDAADGSLISQFEMNHTVEEMAFLPDDQSIAASVSVGGVKLHNLANGEPIHEFHGGYDSFLALSPDGSLIATGNREGIVWLWGTAGGELVAEMDPGLTHDGFSEYISSLAFSPDGQTIAAGYWDGSVFLWDAASHELISALGFDSDNGNAWDVAFSTDGKYLAVGGARVDYSDVIAIWDVSEQVVVKNLEEYSRSGSRQAPLAFSPDGSMLAAGSQDGIYIWSLPNFELVHHLPIEDLDATDWVTDLAFSPDSQQLLAGYWDSYALLWQVQPVE